MDMKPTSVFLGLIIGWASPAPPSEPDPCGPELTTRLKGVWMKSFDGEPLDDAELQTFQDAINCIEACRE